MRLLANVFREVSVVKRQIHSLIECSWLSDQLKREDHKDKLRLVQASWDACEDYRSEHIEHAVCFDGIECSDKASPFKNTKPSEDQFARYVGDCLGISNKHQVVLYDGSDGPVSGLRYSTRVWFLFRLFGHENVSILNGGLTAWKNAGYPTTNKLPDIKPENFLTKFNKDLYASFEDVSGNLKSGEKIVVDSRSFEAFSALEPTYDFAGRIPGSLSFPSKKLKDPNSGQLINTAEILKRFELAKVNSKRPWISSCGSGMNACIIAFAAHLAGKNDVSVYDGSWHEWCRKGGKLDEEIIREE